MASNSSENTMKQAQHIWSMLDDLAAQNPEAYRKFIDKHLTEGREAMRPPEPHMCVRTVIKQQTKHEALFINIMDWPRIPAPKSDEDPIPTLGCSLFTVSDDDGSTVTVVPVAFNSKVLQDYGIDSSLMEERRLLINLAIDYIEDQNKVTLSRDFVVLPKSTQCKGPVAKSKDVLLKKFSGKDTAFSNELGELEKTFGPLAAGCKDALLQDLSCISSRDDEVDNAMFQKATSGSQPQLKLPGETVKSGVKLIEEVRSTETHLVRPDCTIEIVSDDSAKLLVIRIHLPGVSSVRECSLEISDDDLNLVVPDRYELALSFPERIVPFCDKQSAKFSKRTSVLTLTVPIDV